MIICKYPRPEIRTKLKVKSYRNLQTFSPVFTTKLNRNCYHNYQRVCLPYSRKKDLEEKRNFQTFCHCFYIIHGYPHLKMRKRPLK